MGNKSSSQREALPIETTFKLPADIPVWPQGDGFGKGIIDLGELQVSQISTFTKIWTTFEGGPDNGGATFFEPSSIPQGFFMLGCYCQPNNKPLFGSVLVAKQNNSSTTTTQNNEPLKKPLDYTLIWTTKSQNIKQDNTGYVWLPTPPDGYKALGHVITVAPEKPSLDKIRCVRSDLTEEAETYSWIWGPGKSSNDSNGFNVYATRPINRGIIQAQGVPIGTFIAQNSASNSTLPLSCLKNTKTNNFSSMPNLPQIKALIQAYSPIVYLHPDEEYLPSSVNWYFSNGALLYKKGEESKPIPVDPSGSNLPQGGDNDGAYWLDLPEDKTNKERVKNGDLQSSQGYIHVKPMFGSTFTDICIWIFYPFNGPSRAKLGLINVSLGKIGEHVGDWEHVTLRISNFNGGLNRVYFSQHSGGEWVDSSELEFRSGTNKPAAYSSLHGHAMYSKPGLVLQGGSTIGIRNDAARSEKVLDLGLGFEIVSGEYLGTGIVVEPPWLNYLRHWGPKISYDLQEELDKVEKVLPANLRSAFQKIEDSLPNELLGEDGPTGPKLKRSWNRDEV